MAFMNALSKGRTSQTTLSSCSNTSADYYSIPDDEDTSSLANYETLSPSATSRLDLNSNDEKNHKCTICIRRFDTQHDCMRHELLEHMNGEKTPKKLLRKTLTRLVPVFEQSEKQYNRQRIHELFRTSRPGMELYELFKIYCVSFERSQDIISAVKRCLRMDLRSLQRVEVHTYGSCENGLMLWDSDIDIYVTVLSPEYRYRHGWRPNDERHRNTNRIENVWIRKTYNLINSCLRRGQNFDEVITIRHARVPIIKCRHITSGMRVDINNSCPNSAVNTDLLRALILFDVRIHNFMRFMKIWAKKLCIAGRNRMTSYCFCTLLLFYLQQPHYLYEQPLVPPIELLQLNVTPKIINCVNYAFDLSKNLQPLPRDLSTSSLIRGFFVYYRSVKFTNEIIAPFLGKIISVEDFRSGGEFNYTEYLKQLESMRAHTQTYSHEEGRIQIEELNTQTPMIVQDAFQLNHNISRGVLIDQLDYFRNCIEYGYHTCMDAEIHTDAQLYEALLFNIFGNIQNEIRQLQNCKGQNSTLLQPHELIYSFTPTRAEIRALRAQQLNMLQMKDSKSSEDSGSIVNIYELWMIHYIEAIFIILTQIYRFKVEPPLTDIDDPHDSDKINFSIREFKQKNEVDWIISCGLNTWSERVFQRESGQTFMSFQCAQTKKLLQLRQGKSAFAVEMIGCLSLKAIDNFKTLKLVLKQCQQTREGFCKNEPMRKFFSNFRVCLQNFSLKEKMTIENAHVYRLPCNSET